MEQIAQPESLGQPPAAAQPELNGQPPAATNAQLDPQGQPPVAADDLMVQLQRAEQNAKHWQRVGTDATTKLSQMLQFSQQYGNQPAAPAATSHPTPQIPDGLDVNDPVQLANFLRNTVKEVVESTVGNTVDQRFENQSAAEEKRTVYSEVNSFLQQNQIPDDVFNAAQQYVNMVGHKETTRGGATRNAMLFMEKVSSLMAARNQPIAQQRAAAQVAQQFAQQALTQQPSGASVPATTVKTKEEEMLASIQGLTPQNISDYTQKKA